MRNSFSTAVLAFLVMLLTTSINAQQKEITLEEIWGGKFSTKTLQRLHPLNDGAHYSVIESKSYSGTSEINKYEYKSGGLVETLVSAAAIPGLNRIDSYAFSADETKILLGTNLIGIYRHSNKGFYYVYDRKTSSAELVVDLQIQEPTFSPDGTQVAYVYNNNIYVKNLASGQIQQITTDGEINKVINGCTDWVYEEEFAFVRAYEWSSDGKKMAYLRFDESEVPELSMDVYGSKLYPTQQVFKYPKAGEENSKVSLHLYDMSTGKTQTVNLSEFQSYYIPRIKWTQDANILSAQLLNRHQNVLDLVFVDASDATTKLILQEKDAAYVDVNDHLTFLNDNGFIWMSEKSGWNHLYLYDRKGKLMRQITKGPWEVTNFYGFNPLNGRLYYQSTENGSINRDVYSILRNGDNKIRLTSDSGTNSAQFSADFSVFINTFSNTQTPYTYTLHNGLDGKPLRVIKNNDAVKALLENYTMSPKEFSTIQVNGESLNMYMIKPANFDPSKAYPMLMYQYSGPGSQSVENRWNGANDYWHQMLAQKGVIVVCVDGRGTGLKGRDFKKMTQLQLGKYEVEDQIAVAQKLGKLPYIDAARIGIWGWSYGGFMASNCLFQGADTFSMAIAVAPVTSWRFYDTVYTERYMTTPQENPQGYDDNSPLTHVDKLQGDFLLVHGSADDNVHVQNTMRLAEALIQADKQFEWAVYPDKNHGIYGGNTRKHLFRKMTVFIEDHLLGDEMQQINTMFEQSTLIKNK